MASHTATIYVGLGLVHGGWAGQDRFAWTAVPLNANCLGIQLLPLQDLSHPGNHRCGEDPAEPDHGPGPRQCGVLGLPRVLLPEV